MAKKKTNRSNDSLSFLLEYHVDLNNRTIYLHEDIEESTASRVTKLLNYFEKLNEKTPIMLSINSYGGEIYAAMSIVDAMQSCKCEIITEASGICASAASLIFVAGQHRVAYANTSFMLHEIYSFEADRHSQIKNNMKHMDQLMNQMCDIYTARTKINKKELMRRIVKDWYLTAQEAKDRGIVDVIIGKDK